MEDFLLTACIYCPTVAAAAVNSSVEIGLWWLGRVNQPSARPGSESTDVIVILYSWLWFVLGGSSSSSSSSSCCCRQSSLRRLWITVIKPSLQRRAAKQKIRADHPRARRLYWTTCSPLNVQCKQLYCCFIFSVTRSPPNRSRNN